MTRSADPALVKWVSVMMAVNLALPFALQALVQLTHGHAMRLSAVLICAVILITLNGFILPVLPRLRGWVWAISVLNVLSTLLLGAVAFITALGAWSTLLRWLIGGA